MEFNDTVLKHFKKIDDKRDDEKFQIKNIDFIYLINLDRRPERLEQSLKQLEPYQIRPVIERTAVGENFFKIGGRTQTRSYIFR